MKGGGTRRGTELAMSLKEAGRGEEFLPLKSDNRLVFAFLLLLSTCWILLLAFFFQPYTCGILLLFSSSTVSGVAICHFPLTQTYLLSNQIQEKMPDSEGEGEIETTTRELSDSFPDF
jgi:hypothetical protein